MMFWPGLMCFLCRAVLAGSDQPRPSLEYHQREEPGPGSTVKTRLQSVLLVWVRDGGSNLLRIKISRLCPQDSHRADPTKTRVKIEMKF